ncbi:hypothetical protein B0T19DRAFT_422422 [Cercophora scortea]|uniref:Uncharacterized protein n=1 Tax=Cercophora scortea TaxID=314031 RepID=A0AAE0MDG0_9PEZI|nr:hypothetical protein B0T19DRAFT_422422 [Cercophora scortea]
MGRPLTVPIGVPLAALCAKCAKLGFLGWCLDRKIECSLESFTGLVQELRGEPLGAGAVLSNQHQHKTAWLEYQHHHGSHQHRLLRCGTLQYHG